MKLYLAGPINGCTDAEANDWRTAVKKLHPDCLDPMARDYRGKEAESVNAIVEGDKADIDACDCVLVYFERPSVGTSMEVLYAWERKKPVVVVNRSGKLISPWLAYHGKIVETIEQAIEQAKPAPQPAAAHPSGRREPHAAGGQRSQRERVEDAVEAAIMGHDNVDSVVDGILALLTPPAPGGDAGAQDSALLDWLDLREVKVGECWGHGVEPMFTHVPAGYGLSDTSSIRESIRTHRAATRPHGLPAKGTL